MTTINNDELITKIEEKNKEINKLNKKVDELKKDLSICLKHNDTYNLEIRKVKLYNFLFKIIGSVYISTNLYYYFFRKVNNDYN
jgi:hypothetical protein